MRILLATIATLVYVAGGLVVLLLSIPRVWRGLYRGRPKLDLPVIIDEAGREVSEEMACAAQPQGVKRVDDVMRDGELALLYPAKMGSRCDN